MIIKDLNELSKQIYEANKAKGFHEEKHSFEHMACLVISELMEAVEADRKGRIADLDGFNKAMEHDSRYPEGLDESFEFNFKNHIKDTVEDELCDAVIRLLDTAGALGINIDHSFVERHVASAKSKDVKGRLLTENIYFACGAILESDNKPSVSINNTLVCLIILCETLNIDLWKHVELKLKYNSLRPYKHGKAY